MVALFDFSMPLDYRSFAKQFAENVLLQNRQKLEIL